MDACKLSPSVVAYLTEAGVSTLPYNDAIQYVRNMGENDKLLDGKKIWCDGKTVNFAMFNSVKSNIRIDKESPVTIMKSTKNEVSEYVNQASNALLSSLFFFYSFLYFFSFLPTSHPLIHPRSHSPTLSQAHSHSHTPSPFSLPLSHTLALFLTHIGRVEGYACMSLERWSC